VKSSIPTLFKLVHFIFIQVQVAHEYSSWVRWSVVVENPDSLKLEISIKLVKV